MELAPFAQLFEGIEALVGEPEVDNEEWLPMIFPQCLGHRLFASEWQLF